MKKKTRSCIVRGCPNTKCNDPNVSFFSLPKDEDRREQWLIAASREDIMHAVITRTHEVCETHFKPSDIKIFKQLMNKAVPTENLFSDVLSTTDVTDLSQSEDTKDAPALRKMKLTEALEKIQRVLNKVHVLGSIEGSNNGSKWNEGLESAHSYKVTNTTLQKLSELIEMRKELPNVVEWALKLYYFCPQAYRCLRSVLKLPTTRKLRRLHLKTSPVFDLDHRVLNSLSLKMQSLPKNAKYCAISLEEVSLKRGLYYDVRRDNVFGFSTLGHNDGSPPEFADKAYVVMLQGIFCDWKQPIACTVAAGDKLKQLEVWLDNILQKIILIGVVVKVMISNQGSNFDKYAKLIKRVTIEDPYFYIGKHKIYYIFDVPDLFNGFRNCLLTSDVSYFGHIVCWKYIKTLYEEQRERNLKLIPKVTDAHIEPNDSQKRMLKYSAQIFSRTVAGALDAYVDFGKLPEEARATAQFLKFMNDIFDVLNCNETKSTYIKNQQRLILINGSSVFSKIKGIKRSKTKKDVLRMCINFQITIQSMLHLSGDLKLQGLPQLLARRVNLNNVQYFLRAVSARVGYDAPLTTFQFLSGFSKLFLTYMLKKPSIDISVDIDHILDEMIKHVDTPIRNPKEKCKTSSVHLGGHTDYRISLPPREASTYVASYLLYKCSRVHLCQMTEMLQGRPMLHQTTEHYTNEKLFHNLKLPPKDIVECVKVLDSMFVLKFPVFFNHMPGSTLHLLMRSMELPLPCECTDYFSRLFVRLRVYTTIAQANRALRADSYLTRLRVLPL